MLRVFIGYDPRVAMQYHVLAHSLLEHTSIPLQIIPLNLKTLPIERKGLTEFTFSRFLVPWLSGFEGLSLFLDSDMLCTGDIASLIEHPGSGITDDGYMYAVAHVSTNPAYERASMMVFNCAHPDNKKLTPDYVEAMDVERDKPHLIGWTEYRSLLPHRFNFLVNYDKPEWCDGKTPTLIHYTAGVPAWPETANCDYADHWIDARARAFTPGVSWSTLMSSSNHAAEGPGGVKIPAPRVPDAVHQPDHAPIDASELAHAPERRGADGRRP